MAVEPEAEFTPLRAGVVVTLATFGIAAAVSVVDVLTVDRPTEAVGQGVGIALVLFLAGAVVATGLATLRRRRHETVSMLAIVLVGVGLDLLVVARWVEIETDAYAKITSLMLLWAFLLFLVLALVLSTGGAEVGHTRTLFAVTALLVALVGVLFSHLILAGRDALDDPFGLVETDLDGAELRLIGATLVAFAACWFGTLALSRLEPERT